MWLSTFIPFKTHLCKPIWYIFYKYYVCLLFQIWGSTPWQMVLNSNTWSPYDTRRESNLITKKRPIILSHPSRLHTLSYSSNHTSSWSFEDILFGLGKNILQFVLRPRMQTRLAQQFGITDWLPRRSPGHTKNILLELSFLNENTWRQYWSAKYYLFSIWTGQNVIPSNINPIEFWTQSTLWQLGRTVSPNTKFFLFSSFLVFNAVTPPGYIFISNRISETVYIY